MKAVLLFHLNLAFSSIPEESREKVIKTCYWPLLNLAEADGIRLNIEASGYTLSEIEKLDSKWTARLSELIKRQKIEFIGSGYVQAIFPLLPKSVNYKNIALGLKVYREVLNLRPRFFFTNELAFSESLIDVAVEFGFDGLILEENNISYALKASGAPLREVSKYNKLRSSISGKTIFVNWVDSLNFQKFQQLAHQKIEYAEYSRYISRALDKSKRNYLSVYGSDGEVFNFRPRRFNDEGRIDTDEWLTVNRVIRKLVQEYTLQFELVSRIAADQNEERTLESFNSINTPIFVKKQFHYNVTRWAVTGRADSYINRCCYRYLKFLESHGGSESDWKELCYLWSSDFRTHIHHTRWSALLERLKVIEEITTGKVGMDGVPNSTGAMVGSNINPERVYFGHLEPVSIETDGVRLRIVPGRGNIIESLAFKVDEWLEVIKTFHLGEFSSIELATSYLSNDFDLDGHTPNNSLLYSNNVTTKIYRTDDVFFRSYCAVEKLGNIFESEVIVKEGNPCVELVFRINENIFGNYSLRVFNFYFSKSFLADSYSVMAHNGGDRLEYFFGSRFGFDHSASAGRGVSASNAFGATESQFYIESPLGTLKFEWSNAEYYMIPMMANIVSNGESLVSLRFSISETDDTSLDHMIPSGEIGLRVSLLKPKNL